MRNFPWFSTICQKSVRKKYNRGHIFNCNSCSFVNHCEAISRGSGCHNRNGAFAVSAKYSLEQVCLLGFCRKPGARSASLYICNNQRQLDHYSKVNSFLLKCHPRAACTCKR